MNCFWFKMPQMRLFCGTEIVSKTTFLKVNDKLKQIRQSGVENRTGFFRENSFNWMLFFFLYSRMLPSRLQRWSPLPSMVFQWFYRPWTITIECFLQINHWHWWFSMVFQNSGAMVSDGFGLEKNLKMRIIATDPLLRHLCVSFRIQITLLLVNLRCK